MVVSCPQGLQSKRCAVIFETFGVRNPVGLKEWGRPAVMSKTNKHIKRLVVELF